MPWSYVAFTTPTLIPPAGSLMSRSIALWYSQPSRWPLLAPALEKGVITAEALTTHDDKRTAKSKRISRQQGQPTVNYF